MSDSNLPKKVFFICLNESPLKMMKNAFYFMLKALIVIKIFNFLLMWENGLIGKIWLISNLMMSQPG